MSKRLDGKVAIVFGAGSVGPGWGNGKATAATFAREGARVVCVDIKPDAAEETVGIIRGEGNVATAGVCDVTSSDSVAALVAQVIAEHGRIDVLHNNVGYAQMGGPIELSEADWRRTIDLNVTGCFLTCKHVLPHMLAQGGGAIVNVSSIAAVRYTGYPYVAYYAAKAAVNNFTMGLALQYAAQGIRVNAIMPGLMNTPLIYQQISGQYATADEMVAARDAACPTGKMGTAWDIAKAALFLASDEAALHHRHQPAGRWRPVGARGMTPAARPAGSRLPDRDGDRPGQGRRDHGRRAVLRHLRARAGRDAGAEGALSCPGRAAGGAGRAGSGAVVAHHRRRRPGQAPPRPRHAVVADGQSRPVAAQPARHGGRQSVRAAPVHRLAGGGAAPAAGLCGQVSGTALRRGRHAAPVRRRRPAVDRHHHQAVRRLRPGGDGRAGRAAVRRRDRLHQGRRAAGRWPGVPIRRPGQRRDGGRQPPCRPHRAAR